MNLSIFTNNSDNHYNYLHVETIERVTETMKYLKENLCEELFPLRQIRSDEEAKELIQDVHGDEYLLKLKPRGITKCLECMSPTPKEMCIRCPCLLYFWCPEPDTFMTNETVDSILDAVLSIKDGVDELKRTKYVYMVIRPPGHHCNDKPTGFCIINNAIIAAQYARKCGYHKVVIVDWDYHHFNGTAKFLNDDICGVSIHAYGKVCYPGTGSLEENKSYMKNIPLNINDEDDFEMYDDDFYLDTFQNQVIPFILDHNPDLIIISNGLDAHKDDPVGGMNITNRFFIEATRMLKLIDVPLLYLLEGGYNIKVVKTASLDIIEELIR